ncbi:hypothetical protein C8R47DRAFT_1210787 [Mycena vitilis]|nr:hypothetical protein C8R47DRAFT_1210787 [Mycena vitilis]
MCEQGKAALLPPSPLSRRCLHHPRDFPPISVCERALVVVLPPVRLRTGISFTLVVSLPVVGAPSRSSSIFAIRVDADPGSIIFEFSPARSAAPATVAHRDHFHGRRTAMLPPPVAACFPLLRLTMGVLFALPSPTVLAAAFAMRAVVDALLVSVSVY